MAGANLMVLDDQGMFLCVCCNVRLECTKVKEHLATTAHLSNRASHIEQHGAPAAPPPHDDSLAAEMEHWPERCVSVVSRPSVGRHGRVSVMKPLDRACATCLFHRLCALRELPLWCSSAVLYGSAHTRPECVRLFVMITAVCCCIVVIGMQLQLCCARVSLDPNSSRLSPECHTRLHTVSAFACTAELALQSTSPHVCQQSATDSP